MSQSGFTPIKIYSSTTAAATPAAGNLTNDASGSEIAINITDGKLFYKDNAGVVQVLATKNSSAGVFSSITDSGNLTFTGTGNRITGDFSNGTVSSRPLFQSSGTNLPTNVGVIPNGTSTVAITSVWNSSSPDNASFGENRITAAEYRLTSGIAGTGTYLPMTFYTGGSERVRVDTSGNVGIGITSPTAKLSVLSSAAEVTRFTSMNAGGGYSVNYFDNATPWYIGSAAPLIGGPIADLAILGGSGTTGKLLLGANGATALTINTSGNVGIGTSSPSVKLDVNGQRVRISATTDPGVELTNTSLVKGYLYYETATDVVALRHSSSTGLYATSTGNVGIGTSSPGAKLDVMVNTAATTYAQTWNIYNGATFQCTNTIGGDSTNGVYFGPYQSVPLRFITNNTERMRIDSAGNVGIGATTLANKFTVAGSQTNFGTNPYIALSDVYNNTPSYIQYLTSDNALSFVCAGGANTGYIKFATGNGSERMRIAASGNVGIGTNTPDNYGRLGVVSADNATTIAASGASQLIRLQGYIAAYGASVIDATNTTQTAHLPLMITSSTTMFGISGAEKMRLDSSGNLLVGKNVFDTTTQGVAIATAGGVSRFTRNGGASCIFAGNSSQNLIEFNIGSTTVGSISVSGSSTAYNTSSDYRLKENVRPMQNALATVAQLNPVTYNWKSDGSDGQGFIAHELQAVVPDCVTGEKDAVDADGKPVYQGVDTSFLVATLVKAIQEQQAIITDLKARIETLEAA